MKVSQWTFPSKWVLPVVLIVFLIPVISTEYSVLSFTHGIFSYPFDDTFIHLAIAKNIAFHGVWVSLRIAFLQLPPLCFIHCCLPAA